MKRTIIIIISVFLVIGLFPQNKNLTVIVNTIPISEGVIAVDETTKSEIYIILREWVTLNFVSANDVIQMENSEIGKLIVKGLHIYNYSKMNSRNRASYTLELDVKDNRFKYKITITEVLSGKENFPMLNNIIIPEIPLKSNGKPGGKWYKDQRLKQRKSLTEFLDTFVNSLLEIKRTKKVDW